MEAIFEAAVRTVRRWIKSPRTTVPGVVAIMEGAGTIYRNPSVLFDPTHAAAPVTAIVLGLGLLEAAAQQNEPEMPKPQDPPKS